jgi:hypothetical protein
LAQQNMHMLIRMHICIIMLLLITVILLMLCFSFPRFYYPLNCLGKYDGVIIVLSL